MDLLPKLGQLYFARRLGIKLAYSQALILAGMALQFKKIDDVAKEGSMEVGQAMALLNKLVRKSCSTVRKCF